ncbi:AraC family transcriptional regulator [Melittangium boletus]|uniref:AraC family transcriptional regulator n=1 Tax=Melittangium boletus TaxID=83453 RepID=UPI003DA25A83
MHRGEMTCEASNALWLVPPQSALWIPGGTSHRIKVRAPFEGFSLFVEPDTVTTLPGACCSVVVSPLLRELLFRAAALPVLYPLDGKEARLISVVLDELAAAQVEDLRLPMPTDARLRRLAEALTARPADGATMDAWARRMGMGTRTLNRLLVRETGMSFGRWRQRLHIILALQWLTRGASVQSVAVDLGYESASSFVTMFRKALGTSPARYITRRIDLARAGEGD